LKKKTAEQTQKVKDDNDAEVLKMIARKTAAGNCRTAKDVLEDLKDREAEL
jgi:hypothetical protein